MRIDRSCTLWATAFVLLAAAGARAADPACDDFERPALGPDWTRFGGSNAAIVAASDLGSPDSAWCFAGYSASGFAADQWSHALISRDKPANMLTQVFVRRRASDLARYGFHYNGDPGRNQWEIKFDGVPTAQTRILANLAGGGPAPGDSICIEVEGSTIRGYHNGLLLLSATDTAPDAITAAGVAGMVSRAASTTTPPTPIFESWKGGTLVPGACDSTAVLLYAVKRSNDVELSWSGGSAPHDLERAETRPPNFGPLASCLTGSSYGDAAVVGDGRLLFYRRIR